MDINQKINKDDQFVIGGESMAQLVLLTKHLQDKKIEMKGSIFDWPFILREIVANAEKAPDVDGILTGVQGAG